MEKPKNLSKPHGFKGWLTFILSLLSAIGGVLLEHFGNLIN